MYSSLSYSRDNGFNGFYSSIKEEETNREASTFIANNYAELINAAHRMNCDPLKVEDLVQDVTVSILKSENEGNGYNMNRGRNGRAINVAEFVFSRLKLYSKNVKYRKPTEAPIKKASKKDLDNKKLRIDDFELNIIPSTSLVDDVDTMTTCQKAYAQAASYDEMADVEEMQSFEEELNYVLSFDKACDGKIKYLIKNIDILKSNVDGLDLSNILKFNQLSDDFREAITSVIKFSGTNNKEFKRITAKVIG